MQSFKEIPKIQSTANLNVQIKVFNIKNKKSNTTK